MSFYFKKKREIMNNSAVSSSFLSSQLQILPVTYCYPLIINERQKNKSVEKEKRGDIFNSERETDGVQFL